MALQVLVETERPGIVMVRAVASVDKQNDGRPVAGFFVRRRYHGDTFMIARWEDFSQRWMEFVDPSKVPADWPEKIKAKYGEVPGHQELEQYEEPATFSMQDVLKGPEGTINQSTGQIKRRGRPPKQQVI